MLFFCLVLALMGSSYYPTETLPWPTRKPRIKWPTETQKWDIPPTEFPPEPSENKPKFTAAMIAAIVIGAVAFLAIILGLVFLFIRYHRKSNKINNNESIEKIEEKLLD